jgi:tetratricopeptide (TPR) repeat protein
MRAGTKFTLIALVAALSGWVRAADPAGTALAAGWENYRLSEFERAVRFFEEALQQAPADSDTRLQALYGLGTVWNLRRPNEDRKKAEAYFQQVMAAAPRGDVGAWTALALARMKHLVPVGEEPDVAAVRQAYTDVMRRYPGHLAAKEAFIYAMSTFIATLEEAQTRYAIANLQRFVQKPGAREFLQPAWSLMAVGYTTLKQPELRLYAEIMGLKTTEVDPANPFNEFAWAYWNIATIAEFETGNFALARQYYRRLLREYPNDIRVFGVKQALERMDRVEGEMRKGDRRLEIRDSKAERPARVSPLKSPISYFKSPISGRS